MRFLILIMAYALTGCAQLMHGQAAPVATPKVANQKLLTIDCSGPANDWGVCYSAAGQSCQNGYDVTDKFENTTSVARVLTVRCK